MIRAFRIIESTTTASRCGPSGAMPKRLFCVRSKTLSNHSVNSAAMWSNCGSISGWSGGKDRLRNGVEALICPRFRLGYPPGIGELWRQGRRVHGPTARPFSSQDGLFSLRELRPRPVHFIENLILLDGLFSRILPTNQPKAALQLAVVHEFPRHVGCLSHARCSTTDEFPRGSSHIARIGKLPQALRSMRVSVGAN